MKLGMQVGLGPGHIVLDKEPAPLTPKGHRPQFSDHIYSGQMAVWIKMPLCVEVGIGPDDFMFDGTHLPLRTKGTHTPPNFGPCLLWPNG